MSRYGDLAAQLDAVVADLDDLALDTLREALADGRSSRPPSDREVTRARRAVEKAAGILHALDRSTVEPD
jgi:hypothetical protein